MANSRRPFTALQGLSDPPSPRLLLRSRPLLLIVGAVLVLALGVLAFLDGGEQPMRPITAPVTLAEQRQ